MEVIGLLANKESRAELGESLGHILRGIKDSWNLTTSELSKILHLSEGTVKGYVRPLGIVGLSSALDANTTILINFIKIYGIVSSSIVSKGDQSLWMRSPKGYFLNKSPIELMQIDIENAFLTKELISRYFNP